MWKDAYLIGVDQIDQQHKMLINTLDDFVRSLQENSAGAEEKCKRVISFLKDYGTSHFQAEEIFQRSINYPFAEDHHRKHEEFKTRLHEMDLDLIRTGYSQESVQQVVSFLIQWWIYHIMKEDRRMIEYI